MKPASAPGEAHRGSKGTQAWVAATVLLWSLALLLHSRDLRAIAFAVRSGTASRGASGLNLSPIPRLSPQDLPTSAQFFARHGNEPVIVEGLVADHDLAGMTFQSLADLCAGNEVMATRFDGNSTDWAGLVDGEAIPFRSYILEHVLGGAGGAGGRRYASGDVPLFQVCPDLDLRMRVPRYVAAAVRGGPLADCRLGERQPEGDDLERAQVGAEAGRQCLVDLGQPEVFIGPAGSRTELHIDSGLTPFWMSVYMGRKTFRVIRFEDYWPHREFRLEHRPVALEWAGEAGEGYEQTGSARVLEVWSPRLDLFPSLSRVRMYEGEVRAGDFIYLPAGSYHAVRNDEASLGVSMNVFLPQMVRHFSRVCAAFLREPYDHACASEVEAINKGCDERAISEGGFEEVRRCVEEAPLMAEARRRAEEDAGEVYLHEMYGFASYGQWCRATCAYLEQFEESGSRAHVNTRKACASCGGR